MVNDSTPIEEVRKSIDKYLAENNMVLDLKKSRDLNYLLSFAIKDTIRNISRVYKAKCVILVKTLLKFISFLTAIT